jgi:phospholipid N-methyltransferase
MKNRGAIVEEKVGNSKTLFLRTMLKDYKVAAVSRSSNYAVRKILSNIDWQNHNQTIVEYGPGDGVITREIAKRMKGGRIIVVETNDRMVETLREIGDQKIDIEHQDVEKFLEEKKLKEVNAGIPFSYMRQEKREKIVKETFNILKKNGYFVIYQNSTLMLPILKKHFSRVKTTFEPRNFLPYFIMKAEK